MVIQDEGDAYTHPKRKYVRNVHKLIKTLSHVALTGFNLRQFSASLQAASIEYIARRLFLLEVTWPSELVEMTSYEESDLDRCVA